MRSGASLVWRLDYRGTILMTVLLTTIVIIGNPLKLQAQAGIGFYSPNAPPAGWGKSFQPLIEKWWDWLANEPSKAYNSWPVCLKADATVGNRSVVFLGDPAAAPSGGANANATHQVCQISSSPILYLHVYGAYCSQGDSPGKSIPQLLTCAQDENRIIKLMQVKVDGNDVSSNIVRETTSNPWILTIPSSDNAFSEKLPCCGEAMAENYFLLFKTLPTGHHTISVEVIRVPLQPNQPVEHDLAKWDVNVV